MSRTLTPDLVEPLLRGRFGHPYLYRPVCASTQELVRGRPEGTLAACEQQTAGRGRREREWVCPHGAGVLFSLALTPRTLPQRLAAFSLVAAEAVCQALHPAARVRWPNDVVVDGRKLAGVLLELRAGEMILGVGINANLAIAELPPQTRVPATSLLVLQGAPVDRPALLAEVIWELERRYLRFEQHGFEGLSRDELRGRQVTLRGGRSGRCEGVDGQGRLVVDGVAHVADEVEQVEVES